MPLDVKPLPHPAEDDNTLLAAEDRLAAFIRAEVDRAVHDVERRKRLASAELEQDLRRARKRIVTRGHRLERSLRATPFPTAPLSIGVAIIAAAFLLTHRKLGV